MNCKQITYGMMTGLAAIGAVGIVMLPAIAHEHRQTTTTQARRDSAVLPEVSQGQMAPDAEPMGQEQMAPSAEPMNQMIAQCNSMMSMMPSMMGNGDGLEMMHSQPLEETMMPQPRER